MPSFRSSTNCVLETSVATSGGWPVLHASPPPATKFGPKGPIEEFVFNDCGPLESFDSEGRTGGGMGRGSSGGGGVSVGIGEPDICRSRDSRISCMSRTTERTLQMCENHHRAGACTDHRQPSDTQLVRDPTTAGHCPPPVVCSSED